MTQLDAAKQGIITEEMKEVALEENLNSKFILEGIYNGEIVIPKNNNRRIKACGIGKGLKTKINANIGTSEKHCNLKEELEKASVAIKYGADTIMDLSTGGNLDQIRKIILDQCPVAVGTVPIYAVISKLFQQNKEITHMTPDMLFSEIEHQAQQGVDFITVHCGITRRSLLFLEKDERILGVVSRGGSLLKRWMKEHEKENPLYEYYDRLLNIAKKHDVTLSLGDGFRPGSQKDATDRGQIAELLVIGELVEQAHKEGVQVIVEGPGHIPLNEVSMNVQLEKKICNNAPFYVLGPLTTDIAPGYDHIVGAIGGAIAASSGADYLCYVTPAEHLCLPTIEDVKAGVIASKIAAHSADIVKGIKSAVEQDQNMSKARRRLDWETIYKYSIDPELAKDRKESSESKEDDFCTICGRLCAVKTDKY